MDKSEIRNRFSSTTGEGIGNQWLHQHINDSFVSMATDMVESVPESRERSIMLTKLEEARFWANAGVSRNVRS